MSDLSRANPVGRFSGRAKIYASCRPDYPAEAIDFIVKHCGLGAGSLLVDVGCGTGISTRLFARRGIRVIGIEPNADMRAQALAEPAPAGLRAPEYREGTAEATGLPDAYATAVLAAQAFHWFKADAALAEFQRILQPDGWAVLMWNERDESDPFTAAYGAVIRTAPDTAAVEGPRGRAGEVLLTDDRFTQRERVRFHHEQPLDEEGVLGRAFSASYAPKEPAQAAAFTDSLRAVFRRFEKNGRVALQYQTSVFLGKRVDPVR